MATPYIDIISRAQFRVTDYSFLKMKFQMHYDIMHKFLMSAVSDFSPYCLIDLNDRDETLAQFNQDLDDECQEILACGIVSYWMSSKTLNSELLYNRLSTKEYSYFSPANLLREVVELKKTAKQEFDSAIIKYTYRHGNIETPSIKTRRE